MSRMKLTGAIFLVLLFSNASAGDLPYAVSRIPQELLKNAHVVKRMEEISFEVVNTGEAILTRKYALTILNENGDDHAAFVEFYDKLHEIKDIEGILFDAGGRELRKLRNKQVIDISGVDDNNLMDDNRRKAHHFFHKVYPYTVQYEVRIKYNGTLFFPAWLPRETEHFAVEQSRISIIHDPGYTVRYKAYNYEGEPVTGIHDKKKKIMSWEVRNLPAVEKEFGAPGWHKINTFVLFGPTEFEIEKYRGNMNSWRDFGNFVYALKKDRDELPDAVKTKVREIAAKYPDARQKVAQLYSFMQKNTRYISIQLGIGGWQPFDAKYVASKAYGDCKALTNYMFSLLKEAGIPSVYALVKAGRKSDDVIPDFPSQQFNHVILCVPFKKDTVWLECTSQYAPPGYLGDFTSGRYALLVTENESKLVRTPAYQHEDNVSSRFISAGLGEDATLTINAITDYSGLQQDLYHHLINALSKDKVREFLQEQLDFATYDVAKFAYTEKREDKPSIRESLDIAVSNYANITGRRLFIIPNIMNRHQRRLPADTIRKYDLELGWGYLDKDSVEITIPAGYKPESIPPEIRLTGKFGTYHARASLEGNRISYFRSMTFYGGNFPASAYHDLVKFYEAIYKADRNKIVLVKDELKGF